MTCVSTCVSSRDNSVLVERKFAKCEYATRSYSCSFISSITCLSPQALVLNVNNDLSELFQRDSIGEVETSLSHFLTVILWHSELISDWNLHWMGSDTLPSCCAQQGHKLFGLLARQSSQRVKAIHHKSRRFIFIFGHTKVFRSAVGLGQL